MRAQRVKLEGYKAIILGKMSKDEGGYNRFTEAKASVKIRLADKSDLKKVERAVKLSEKYCPIGRAVRGNIDLKFEISIETPEGVSKLE